MACFSISSKYLNSLSEPQEEERKSEGREACLDDCLGDGEYSLFVEGPGGEVESIKRDNQILKLLSAL
jgi:hypothetical protein